jgi:hypothetical protein
MSIPEQRGHRKRKTNRASNRVYKKIPGGKGGRMRKAAVETLTVHVYLDTAEWQAEEAKHAKWFMMSADILETHYLATYNMETDHVEPSPEQVALIRADFTEPVILIY